MKKILFVFVFCLFSVSMYAQEKKIFAVYMNDGTTVCFNLSKKPVVTFVDDAVKIESETEDALIKRSLVNYFEFLAEMPTEIGNLKENGAKKEKFEIAGNVIRVSGLASCDKVQIFSLDGQVKNIAHAADDGSVTLSLESLHPGIYLVNYNETTIKFIKR